MTPAERAEELSRRIAKRHPWHSPPHRESRFTNRYLFTAACKYHHPHIGFSRSRMTAFEQSLLETLDTCCENLVDWVVLPNHYHALVVCPSSSAVLSALGQLHGRSSFIWNGAENTRGRTVWYNASETAMKSDGHFWATVNYLHHNPVRHGCVKHWQDWPWSSATRFLDEVGRQKASALWQAYPIEAYGEGWDDYGCDVSRLQLGGAARGCCDGDAAG